MEEAPLVTAAEAAAMEASCIGLASQRLARAVSRRYDTAYRPLGLSGWQFTLLMATYRPTAPTITELADWLDMDRTTVTANLKPLTRRGLVAIETDGKDKRVRRAVLTEAGRAILAEAIPLWRGVQASYRDSVGEADLDRLRALVGRLTRARPEPA